MNIPRPDPDELLARVNREQAKAHRGRLKIFFGAAAGVGKTYAMLLAAKEKRAENYDIIIGLVETHGRKETAALMEGLELLPPKLINYRRTLFKEFDLDAALKRKPSIILVDELAHSNVEAVEDGMISPFSVIVAKTKVDISSVEVNTVGEYSQADLEKAVNIASRNKAAVDIYKKMFNGQLALAYCCGVQHAADVAKEFNDAGIPAIMMSGDQDLSEKEKSDIFEKFSRGEIKVITNADILIEGFDEKRVGLCLNLRPTLSPVVAEQRGGRVLRLNKEEDPKKHAYVIDFLDENQNKDFHPITFAEIAGASVVYAKTQDGKDIPDRNTEKADVANIKVEGLEIVVDSEEVMRMVREMESQAAKLPPENWIKLNDFIDKTADTFILPKAEVRRMVAENKLDKPDSFGRFKSVDGYLGQYISPELQNGILDELGSGFKGLPKDYLTLGAMKHELQLTWTPTFKRLFEKAKELVPDGVVNRRGQVYLSKKFFETLRDLSSSEIAPEDWVTESALKKMGHNTALSDLLDDLKEEMPDEIKQLRGKKHGPIPHYSPAFVAEFYKRAEVLKQNEAIRLQKEKELEVAPKDWLDLSDIRIATGQSAKDLEDAYNKYASANSNDNLL